MRLSHKLLIATGALLFVTANVPPASAQINSNTGTVTLNATLSESLTVTVNSGSTVNFALAPNTAVNAGSTTTGVTTAWTLKPGRTAVALWAYFGSATAALVHQTAGNTVDIPSSAVEIQGGGAGPYSAFTALNPFNAAASRLPIGSSNSITGADQTGSRADTLAYQIDTTVVPQLTAGT